MATVTAVDPTKGSFTVERNGRQTTLEASSAEARHLEHGYAQTAQKLQGQTAERALIHAEHWRLNLINQRSFYVLLSRAKDGVTIATSDRSGLIDAIRERSGEQQAALDQLEARQAPEIARAAVQEITQERERQRQQEREQQHQRERALQQRDKSDDDARKASPAGAAPISARSVHIPPPTGSKSAITTTTWATEQSVERPSHLFGRAGDNGAILSPKNLSVACRKHRLIELIPGVFACFDSQTKAAARCIMMGCLAHRTPEKCLLAAQ